MDFGTVVWVPYGSRIIADFGYGSLHGNRYETAPEHPPDQNPTGHSTLIIPEALLDGDPSTNTSQIDGRDGTITMEEIDGHATLLLDGSAVYGRDDPELGWLEHFHRRVVPLDSGHIILIDDFTVGRPSRCLSPSTGTPTLGSRASTRTTISTRTSGWTALWETHAGSDSRMLGTREHRLGVRRSNRSHRHARRSVRRRR